MLYFKVMAQGEPGVKGDMMARLFGVMALFAVWNIGCGNASDETEAVELDSTDEMSSDSDFESDSEASKMPCLARLTGQVKKNGDVGMAALIVVCMGESICHTPQETTADGTIQWRYPDLPDGQTCVSHDFQGDEWLHVEILPQNDSEKFAAYSFVRRPGMDDFDGETLDLGMLSLFELPDESVTYTSKNGATVSSNGISFDIPADGLVKESLSGDISPLEAVHDISVFKAPLDWDPPFLEEKSDALYFIGPRWAMTAEPGLTLSIDAPNGWEDGDTGTLSLLSSWRTALLGEGLVRSDYLYRTDDGRCVSDNDPDNERILEGFVADCGNVEVVDGRILTPPIPRLTWIALFK